MGNEHSQEAPPETQSASDQDDFDLSAIPDTRRNHSSPNQPPASPPATTMARKRKAGRTRANSKKKRKQSRDDPDTESTEEPQPEPADQPDDEELRLAEEIMLREQARRVREREPEMFDEYAISDVSEQDAQEAAQVLEAEEAVPSEVDDQGEALADTATGPDAGENSDQEAAQVHPEPEVGDDEADDAHTSPADAQTKPATDGSNDAAESVVDEQPGQAVVEETPVSKHGKRKRPDNESPESSNRKKSSKKRKRAGLPTPPATGDHDAVDEVLTDVNTAGQSNKSIRRQSSMEDYAQPFTKGSDLRHPVYNPESPEARRVRQDVEVIIPMSTAGHSEDHKKTLDAPISDVPGPSSLQPRSLGLKRRPKGPLSSPVTKGEKEAREDPWDVRAQAEASRANGMATSTARRTLGGDDNESGSEYEHPNDESAESSTESKAKQRKEKGKGRAQASKSRSTTPTMRGGPHTHRCRICNSTFPSEKSLEKHRADPTAHDNLIDCDKCDKQFATRAGLARHQQEKGHGAGNGLQGDTGKFTTDEMDEIDRWCKRFCKENDLTKYEFNEMMTASGKLGNEAWTYKFITKREFVQEYYDVLPRRNVRSMRRYRAKFQNVDLSREFTAQDDADIISLVEQLGQKWTGIGEQLMRDPEILRQRWKNKLMIIKQGKKMNTGVWDDAEEKRFKDAVKEIRRMTISAGIEDVDTFNWTAVSFKVKTRSGQQCANHWRAMHGTNVKGQWVDSGQSQIMKPKSPSKMKQRLSGKELSKSRIEDSDEEAGPNDNPSEHEDEDADNSDSEAPKAEEVGQAPRSDSGADTEDEAKALVAKTPLKRSKPHLFQTKTPANGISASQAFEQTQANTSTLKKSAKRWKRSTPSQEQPTPGITVQTRPERSPEFGKKLDEVLQDQNSNADESDVQAEDAQEDEAASAHEEDNPPDDDEVVEAEEAGQDDEAASVDEEQSLVEEEEEASVIDNEVKEGSEDEARSASEEASEAGSEVSGASDAAKEASKSMSDDEQSEVHRISKIFKNAASPKKTYGRRRQEKPQKGKDYQWPEESQSQSDDSSDGEEVGIDELPH